MIIAAVLSIVIIIASSSAIIFATNSQMISWTASETPVQVHKMPVAFQTFLDEFGPHVELAESYSTLVAYDWMVLENPTPTRIAYYKLTDQAMGVDFEGSNSPGGFCDDMMNVTEQSGICHHVVGQGMISESGRLAALSMAVILGEQYHELNPTKHQRMTAQLQPLDKEIRHSLAILCESDADLNPTLEAIDLDRFREAYKNGMDPQYKISVANHMANGIVMNAAGDVQYHEGEPQKIHQSTIHPDCMP